MSVECEPSAHRTLQLRAFYRQFGTAVPDAYYEYLREGLSREELMKRFPEQAQAAIDETMGQPLALGDSTDDRLIHARLRRLRRNVDDPWVVIGCNSIFCQVQPRHGYFVLRVHLFCRDLN